MKPSFCDAHYRTGVMYKVLGESDEAISRLRVALECGSEPTAVLLNIAESLKQQRRLGEALVVLDQSLGIRPTADAWNMVGNVLQDSEQHEDAIAAYTRAIQIDGRSAHAFHNRANSYSMHEDVWHALEDYERALQLEPEHHMAFAHWLYLRLFACLWDKLPELTRRMREIVRAELAADVPQVSLQAFQAMALRIPPGELRDLLRKHARQFAVNNLRHDFSTVLPGRLVPMRGRRLRVGFMSSGAFSGHVRAHLVQTLFRFLDRTRFETFCYSLAADDQSADRQATSSGCEHFFDIADVDHRSSATLVRSHALDVLFDMNGHTQGARMQLMSLHQAATQGMMIAFAATSGSTDIDYFVGDRVSAPPSLRYHFVEHLLYMPQSYQLNSIRFTQPLLTRSHPLVPSRESLGLPSGAGSIVLCSFNHLYKIDPHIWDVWMRVLLARPGAVLWLLQYPPAAEAALRTSASRDYGLAPERLVFSPVTAQRDRSRHFARIAQCDLFLDTPVYNAHTTGSDALFVGVPLVTLPLRNMASRVAASLLHAAHLGDLVVGSAREYLDKVLALTGHPDQLEQLRARVEAARTTVPLFDSPRWVANFARGLAMMHDARAARPGLAHDAQLALLVRRPHLVVRDVHAGPRR